MNSFYILYLPINNHAQLQILYAKSITGYPLDGEDINFNRTDMICEANKF